MNDWPTISDNSDMGPPKKAKTDGNLNQRTLSAFKFTKTIRHCDEVVTVEIPDVITSKETFPQCDICKEAFKKNQR